MMKNLVIALEIMGMGMLGIFTAMVMILALTTLLKCLDNKQA